MTNPSCASCGGTRWVRYLSQLVDGTLRRLSGCAPATTSQKDRANALVKPKDRGAARADGPDLSSCPCRDAQDQCRPQHGDPLVSGPLREWLGCYPSSRIGRFGAVSVSIDYAYSAEYVS